MHLLRPLALLIASVFASPALAAPEVPTLEREFEQNAERTSDVLLVHYHRAGEDYDGWNLWTWTEGAEGGPVGFGRETGYGRLAIIEVPDDARRQGVILRKNDWEARDIQFDRFVDLDDDGVTEVWLVAGNPTVFTEAQDVDLSVRIVSAFLDDINAITFTTTAPISQRALRSMLVRGREGDVPYRASAAKRSSAQATGGVVYTLAFSPPIAREHLSHLVLEARGFAPVQVYARDALDHPGFTAPSASLGPHYSPEQTTFRVWSPVSDKVVLMGYRNASDTTPSKRISMSLNDDGVWEATLKGDQDGLVYEYLYESYGTSRRGADIHAYAATEDSQRSVVVDLSKTNPDGWSETKTVTISRPTDEIIYEIHVRDFSIRDTSIDERFRGTYAGLVHDGVMRTGGASVRTGLGHLKELGVTAVHLLPIHDYPTSDRDEYNWGYWTSLFNVPESNYATPGASPNEVITELKSAINGLHEAGVRVILDVVYNHTSSSFEYSHFDNSVPFYYFRTTVDGKLRNDAGVGNSIADERVMVNKYISDSLMYWAREYRVDGFRFDLLGTHHPASVRSWVDRLREYRSDLTIYGEPWTGGGPTYFPKGAQRSMGIAVFNDHLRNAIRGDLDGDAQGFVNGAWGDTDSIKRGVMGAIDDFSDRPTETINYASAHDNLTLWDKITKVTPDATDDERSAMQNLAHAIVLTSQGTPFIHGGADFARTKQGNHNSYNAGDDINLFDWHRKHEYRDVFEYTAGLIALRSAHPAFRMHKTADVRRHLSWLDTSDSRLVAYTLNGERIGDEWDTILVAYNGSDAHQTLTLPEGTWNVVVNHTKAGVETIGRASGSTGLPPYSATVLHR